MSAYNRPFLATICMETRNVYCGGGHKVGGLLEAQPRKGQKMEVLKRVESGSNDTTMFNISQMGGS